MALIRKPLFLASLNVAAKFILKSSLIALKPLYKSLYAAVLILTASFTQIDGGAIMSIIESTMDPINLLIVKAI